MGIVEQYLLQLNTDKQRLRRFVAILAVLSLFVVMGVSWNLRMTGITLANDACCGIPEHWHSEECGTEQILICGQTETPEADAQPPATEAPTLPPETQTPAPAEGTPSPEGGDAPAETPPVPDAPAPDPVTVHTHTDSCFETRYLCNQESHLHTLSCYSDTTADIETSAQWTATLPQNTGSWAEDILQIARSQVGSGESQRNFLVSDDTLTRNGITRYGQWYGNPYGDWSGMFAMFTLHYAQVPQEAIPHSPGVSNMMKLALDNEILSLPDSAMGSPGDLLFLDTDGNGNADRIAFAEQLADGELTAIAGDWENQVARITLELSDPAIVGFIAVQALQSALDPDFQPQPPAPEPPAPSEPEQPTQPDVPEEVPSDGPAVYISVEYPEDQEGIIRLVAQPENMDETRFNWQWQISENGGEPWYDIETATGLSLEISDAPETASLYYRVQGRKIMMVYAARPTTGDSLSGGQSAASSYINSEGIMPLSIGKESNVYVVDVYLLPTDSDGNPIPGMKAEYLTNKRINTSTKTQVSSYFPADRGTYLSAYFGTESEVEEDNIYTIWRYSRFSATYYLAFARTNGTQNQTWLKNADKNISLYLRYVPGYTVRFASEGHQTVSEKVGYNQMPTLTDPGNWTRQGYTLLGWTIGDDTQNVYSYEEIMAMPITQDVTYTAQWISYVTVSFQLGTPAPDLYPIEPMVIPYATGISPLPTPGWRVSNASLAFDGWYLNPEFTQPITAAYRFHTDTTLYARWKPVEEGYFVYFMDFERYDQQPLVLMTYSVTEGQSASPFTPTNAPSGTLWDGSWYLDLACTIPYDFTTPVSQLTDHLTGAAGRDLYLYPGTQSVCRAIFVTYGTRIDPVTVTLGGTLNLNQYVPTREGYTFAGWTLKDGTPVSGTQTLNETTTYYAKWNSGYVPFQSILRIENANDTGMTQDNILGTWYAKAGSRIVVKSTYTGTGSDRTGTHNVFCVLDGQEFPVYTDAALSRQASLADVYATYFVYNNTGTNWTDSTNWDDVYTGGELPYSTRPISSTGDSIIAFDYMRVRDDITFYIPNTSTGGYIDVFRLYRDGLITGSVTYTGTPPTADGRNVSATGISAENIRWSYTAAASVGNRQNNTYTLHNMKYGQRIFDVYPVGTSWLTQRSSSISFHQYKVSSSKLFASRREDLTSDFFSGSGRRIDAYTLTAEFESQERIALMYAAECLSGETPDFTISGVGYKVQTQLCEVVRHTGGFGIKALKGFEAGVNAAGTNDNNNYYTKLGSTTATVGGTSVKYLFGEKYLPYYQTYVSKISDVNRAYIFYYKRLKMDIQFNFGYDSNGNGTNEIVEYSGIPYGEKISQYQFGSPNSARNPLLDREGYEFVGWVDANGHVLDSKDWTELVATGDSADSAIVFIAKWEKISNNIVEYYEDRGAKTPFETHYFDDGQMLQYPTMAVYPEGWLWQESGEETYDRFDWDVPMYGEYGVQETRNLGGEDRVVNVIRIYGVWDESHTRVVYDPNPPQGGIPGSAPTDVNEYTIWQSSVPVAPQGSTANSDPAMVFSGWLLDRDGVVYHPGDHVQVRWPRTMIFTAQWAKEEELVHLIYDPNGGTPDSPYPNHLGYSFKKHSTAAVWDNTGTNGAAWFYRTGYTFTGWNTMPDGSGTAYAPNSVIQLDAPVTTLYAQWEQLYHTLTLHKVDSQTKAALNGAVFSLYRKNGEIYQLVETLTTPVSGTIIFHNLETDAAYKLVEERPPNGYAVIAREICFRLKASDQTIALEFYDDQSRAAAPPAGVTAEYITTSRDMTMTVDNLRGYALPATGGIGTPIYMLCGLMLTLGPLVYGFSLRRRYERRSRK